MPTPYGSGGLGQRFAEQVEDARSAGELLTYFNPRPPADDPVARTVRVPGYPALASLPPLRFSAGWRGFAEVDWFDRLVANRMVECDCFVGFVGQSLHSFRGQAAGCENAVACIAHISRRARPRAPLPTGATQ